MEKPPRTEPGGFDFMENRITAGSKVSAPVFYTTLSAQEELAKASGLALNTKPIPRM